MWLRGALILSLLAFVGAGCSNDVTPTQPDTTLAMADGAMPLSIAPDFCPNLPNYPVVVIHHQPGADALFAVWFWGITSGYDIATGDILPGWCVEDVPIPNVQDPGTVMLYCSYDDALPGNLSDLPIDKLNYLINHKIGERLEIQSAIWLLLGYDPPSIPATANSYAMYEDAMANGAGFVPGPGDLVAIFLYTGDGGIGTEGFQETIVEMRLPGDDNGGGDGCTPGYWKTHFDRWEGYLPGDDFDTVFGTDYFDPDITLGEATWARGGGYNKIARHGVAALLNAVHGDIEFKYTAAEVIALVQAGDGGALADANEEYECSLEGTSADPKMSFD